MKVAFAALCVATVLAGCQSTPTRSDVEPLPPLTCSGKGECDMYWARAQEWVMNHSYWRIQAATDNVIATYGPQNTPSLAYRLSRVPNGDGSAKINTLAFCGAIGWCEEDPRNAVLALRGYILNGR